MTVQVDQLPQTVLLHLASIIGGSFIILLRESTEYHTQSIAAVHELCHPVVACSLCVAH